MVDSSFGILRACIHAWFNTEMPSLANILSSSIASLWIVSIIYPGATGLPTITPVELFARRGEEVRLNCSTNESTPVIWYRISWYTRYDIEIIYINRNVLANMSKQFQVVTERPGRYDLIIKNIRLNDTGTYYCRDKDMKAECWLSTVGECLSWAYVTVYDTSFVDLPCQEQQSNCSIESASMSCHMDDPDNNVPSKQSPNWFAFTGGGCCGRYCRYRGCCDALVVLNFTTKCSNAFVNVTGQLNASTESRNVTKCGVCSSQMTATNQSSSTTVLAVACLVLIGIISMQCIVVVYMKKRTHEYESAKVATVEPPNEYEEIPANVRGQQQLFESASSVEGDVVRLNRGTARAHYVNTPSEVDSVEYAESSNDTEVREAVVPPGNVVPPYANLRSRREDTKSKPAAVGYYNLPANN